MEKLRTITRKYFSKKLGKQVTKTYQYDISKYSSRRTKTKELLVTKAGKVHEDRLKEFIKNMSPTEQNEVKRLVINAKSKGKRLTTRSVISQLQDDQRIKMLINAGYTVDEGLAELGVSKLEYLNEENWDGSIFRNPRTGVALQFIFNYNEGSVWQEV